MNFDAFEALTFDCYGTLVDWETGIVRAARELLSGASDDLGEDALLEQFGRFEPFQFFF